MRLCIASPSLDKYSETFIRTHVEQLPFEIRTLSGGALDLTEDGNLSAESLPRKALRLVRRKLGRSDDRRSLIRHQAAWLKRSGVSAVLAEYGPTGVKIAPACATAGVPLVVHFHGYDAHRVDILEKHRQDYADLFRQAAAIIGVSRWMVDRLVADAGAPREKTHHVAYYVDPEFFQRARPEDAPPTFLSVGRFVEKKAPVLNLLAFAEVLKAMPEARLEMAGDGPLLGICQWQAKALGIDHAVTFHGSRDHQWVTAAMQRVRGFLQHSVRASDGDSEGTPVAVLEAQCAGVPVVATRHAGIRDVVVEGVTGYLCDEGDTTTMARQALELLRLPPADVRRMGEAARARVTSEFSRANTLDRLAGILRSVAVPRSQP